MLKDINTVQDGTDITGDILIKSYEVRKTKNGGDFISGQYSTRDGSFGFKVWGGVLCESLKSENIAGKVVTVSGNVDEYGGTKSLIIRNIVEKVGANPLDFYETMYDMNTLNALYNSVTSKLSDEGKAILELLMSEHGDEFKKEFAAISHHDAVPHGLFAHSLKVARIAILMTNMYPGILKHSDKDFYILAAFLHDIGKTVEYSMGSFTEDGYLTHRYFGVRILSKFENQIVGYKGQRWFNRLMSVITQHHGEWGERPQTVEALIIHRIDHLESTLTDIDTALRSSNGTEMRLDGYRLKF